MRTLTEDERALLTARATDFSLEDARAIKDIETTTRHDVKAVEYWLREKLGTTSLADCLEWIHFALTSEDVNSVSYALCLVGARDAVVLPALESIRATLDVFAMQYAELPMLARTHGQPASPTTFGKEMRVFEARLARQMDQIRDVKLMAKFGGATGNWNAHVAAVPGMDWRVFAERFVSKIGRINKMHADARRGESGEEDVLGRTATEAQGPRNEADARILLNPVTTQIEPHDCYAELFDAMRRAHTVLLDFSQDMWRYVSDGWVVQKAIAGEVGSSAMPHKVNPIDFENAEGNLGLANALLEHFSRKLPISRLQRDLSDSTVLRACGTAFAHALVAYTALSKGLGKVSPSEHALMSALDAHPEVLAEAIQTVLRAEGVTAAYDKLKEATRGKKITLEALRSFIDTLEVSDRAKQHLQTLLPSTYIGIAARIATHQ
jgi:adenylosuccinate lyase